MTLLNGSVNKTALLLWTYSSFSPAYAFFLYIYAE